MRPTPTLACALLLLSLSAGSAAAQTQVKPYFLVVFDTSGSMDDNPGSVSNTCNFAPLDKMSAAKCVLGKIVNATGDAEFGLMQFAKGTNNTVCSSGGTCEPLADAAWLRVPIQTNSANAITPLIDNAGAGPANELCPGGSTPLGGSLIAARDYFSGALNYQGDSAVDPAPTAGDQALACRPLAVILMTDGGECCGSCDDDWSGCPKAAAEFGISCISACGNTPGCPDGDHFENAPDRAFELLRETTVPSAAGPTQKEVRTYVIGFGIGAPDARIERIATAGGTDNPSAGPGGANLRGFYASDEAGLSLAFAQIIADAQPPAEVCNNADDDCDTLIDEGIPKYCNLPGGIDMPELCDEPDETLCDGMDDDCDGLIDEGTLNACGVCGDPPAEICDGEDNDCDSRVDEMTEGGECGSDVGRCEKGELRCIGGVEECRGEVPPRDEICNCEDDDCDGEIDEDITGDLCPDGKCIACECVPRCGQGQEFMPDCEEGRTPQIEDSGECFCIIDNCDPSECAESMLEREDEVACAPDDPALAPCLCLAGNCGARCDGVTCGAGDTCNKRNGRCVEDNCRGLGCPASGELCDPLEAECVADPCAETTCADDEVCRDGGCEPSCAGVTCEDDERCRHGRCVEHRCAGVRCDTGELCDERSGECVDNPCPTGCDEGLVCDVGSGRCERDPCWNVHCPSGETCVVGECQFSRPGGRPDDDDDGDPNEDAERVLAAGGGGCSCQSAGAEPRTAAPASRPGIWALVLLAAALLLRARRRRSPGALLAAASAVAVLVAASGCEVTPFCIDCVDAGSNDGEGGDGAGGAAGDDDPMQDGGGAGVDGGGAGEDAGPDGGGPLCTQPEPETCDGKDQDCDFIVDEDVVAEDNDCIQYGLCAGTRPICLEGEFVCRYPDEREDDETLCDAVDNDCDNRVDEAHPALGTACDIGVGACQTQGEQVCGDDHLTLRCEGTPLDAGDEVCDGVDNDCDGTVDEPRSAPGTNPSFVLDDVVEIASNLFIQRYEAARPDATATAQGVINSRACSRAGVLPWTNLTFAEAQAACAASDMRLCTADEWTTICDGPSNNCSWSFTPNAGSCPTGGAGYPANASPANKLACNGHDLMAAPGGADVDALAATGAYPRCFVAFAGENVFDLSGNAKEWTVGADSPAENPLRGGSYNNLPGGMECDFDFAVAGPEVRLRNVGFRCCSDAQP